MMQTGVEPASLMHLSNSSSEDTSITLPEHRLVGDDRTHTCGAKGENLGFQMTAPTPAVQSVKI
jgi:hypothetical protein